MLTWWLSLKELFSACSSDPRQHSYTAKTGRLRHISTGRRRPGSSPPLSGCCPSPKRTAKGADSVGCQGTMGSVIKRLGAGGVKRKKWGHSTTSCFPNTLLVTSAFQTPAKSTHAAATHLWLKVPRVVRNLCKLRNALRRLRGSYRCYHTWRKPVRSALGIQETEAPDSSATVGSSNGGTVDTRRAFGPCSRAVVALRAATHIAGIASVAWLAEVATVDAGGAFDSTDGPAGAGSAGCPVAFPYFGVVCAWQQQHQQQNRSRWCHIVGHIVSLSIFVAEQAADPVCSLTAGVNPMSSSSANRTPHHHMHTPCKHCFLTHLDVPLAANITRSAHTHPQDKG